MPAKPHLLFIPALGCDEELYCEAAGLLSGHVVPRTLSVAQSTLAACADEVLAAAPASFSSRERPLVGMWRWKSAPARTAALRIMGAAAGGAADPEAGRQRAERARGGGLADLIEEMSHTIAFRNGPLGPRARDAFLRMGARCDPGRFALQAEALARREDRWNALTGIACPTLLLWGREDQYSAPEAGVRMARLIGKARFVELPGCGHLPTLEAPRKVASAAIQ